MRAGKLRDRVAQPAFPERPEERQVLAHLRRRRAAALRELGRADRREALRRRTARGTAGTAPADGPWSPRSSAYCELFHNRPAPTQVSAQRLNSRTNTSGASVSDAPPGRSPAPRGQRPPPPRRTARSADRADDGAQLLAPPAEAGGRRTSETARISAPSTNGGARGRSRTTALRTRGGGWNDPAAHREQFLDPAQRLHPDRQGPIGLRARRGRHPVGHLRLHQEHDPFGQRRGEALCRSGAS